MILKEPIISSSPEVMGGTPVFAGTRVPIQSLLDYVAAGESINDFLDVFPTVSREQIIKFLEAAKERMIAKPRLGDSLGQQVPAC